jgi:hypothetical protein
MHVSDNIEQRIEHRTFMERLGRLMGRLEVPIFTLLLGLAIIYGWQVRVEEYWTAESGAGYALGIIGGSLMLSQLLYPMRKNFRWMRSLGKISVWFKYHMAIGLIGPLLILYHANFGLGSINSNVALAAMALVVTSGLIGRYIYTKINQRFHGRIATLEELKSFSKEARSDLNQNMLMDTAAMEVLRRYERDILKAGDSWLTLFPELALLGLRTRLLRWRLKARLSRELRVRARKEQLSRVEVRKIVRSGKRHIVTYIRSIRKVAEYKIYRKIFSLWHVLHIPLFAMLVVSAIAHIVAVHLY